jgi:hypothetical protein
LESPDDTEAGLTRQATEANRQLSWRALMSNRLSSMVFALTGVRISMSEEGYTFAFSTRFYLSLITMAGRVLPVAVLGIVSLVFLSSVSKFPFYGPTTNVEEVAYYYTSAGNFIRYGFLKTTFLQDYSNSSDPAGHPYVYNHMPPGPDIFVALILKASGGNYRLLRLIFWLIFLAGMGCYFRFAGLILGRSGWAGAGYAILFLNPLVLLWTMDDPLYAAFPLFAFLPILALDAYYRTGSRRYIYLMLALTLVGSVYLDYLSLLVVIYCWVLLYLTRLIRLDGKHLRMFLGIICCGVLLHLFQNLAYLGPALFAKELHMMLTNRILGVPSKETMKAFYQSIGVVHHGSTPLNLHGFVNNVFAGFSFPGRGPIMLTLALIVALVLLRNVRTNPPGGSITLPRGEATAVVGYFGRLAIWISGTITLPMVMFPAFTQEYGLYGVGLSAYFLAIGAIAVTSKAVQQVILQWPKGFPRLGTNLWQFVMAVVLVLSLTTGLWHAVRSNLKSLRFARSQLTVRSMGTPGVPERIIANRLDSTTIELSWTRVTDMTEYRIEMDGDFRTPFTQIATTGGGVTSARINGLAANRTYSFRVRACHRENCSPYSQEVSTPSVGRDLLAERPVRFSDANRVGLAPAPFQHAKLQEIHQYFRGHTFMTNINAIVVGFFAEEAGRGVCGPASLPDKGDIDPAQCHSFYVRLQDRSTRMRPEYFFFFPRDLFPGFSDCLPSAVYPTLQRGGDDCIALTQKRLSNRFDKIYDNGLFEVFDLQSPRRW